MHQGEQLGVEQGEAMPREIHQQVEVWPYEKGSGSGNVVLDGSGCEWSSSELLLRRHCGGGVLSNIRLELRRPIEEHPPSLHTQAPSPSPAPLS